MRSAKGFGVRQCLVLAAAAGLMLYVVFFYHGLVAGTIDHEVCKTCHEKTYNEAMAKPFRHSVIDTQCGVCHIAGKEASEKSSGTSFVSSGLHKETLFPLKRFSRDKNDLSVEVTAINASGKRSRPVEEALNRAQAAPFDASPAKFSIEGVLVEEIKEGVFPEAVISWKTGVFAESTLEYRGSGENFRAVSASVNYSKEHGATLGPLKGNAVYYFRISARDPYGNAARSGEFSFSTEKPFKRGSGEAKPRSRPRVEEVKLLKDKNNEFYLLTSADAPSSFTVSVRESVKETLGDKHNNGFQAPAASAIEACVECHPQGSSHPVGISAKTQDTVIPPNLPTLSGGVISCTTCHLPHGGERRYFARMDFKRDICVECHKKNPFI